MRHTGARGFSVIELLVAIAIVAILLAVAFPSFEGSIRRNRVTSTANEIIATLSLARMEGLRNPQGAVICTSADGATCGGTWNDGWMVWIDANGDGAPGGASDRVLRYVQGKPRLTISATSPGGATFANRIHFDNRGRPDTHTRTITVQPDTCPTSQELVRQVGVGLTGQARITKQACT